MSKRAKSCLSCVFKVQVWCCVRWLNHGEPCKSLVCRLLSGALCCWRLFCSQHTILLHCRWWCSSSAEIVLSKGFPLSCSCCNIKRSPFKQQIRSFRSPCLLRTWPVQIRHAHIVNEFVSPHWEAMEALDAYFRLLRLGTLQDLTAWTGSAWPAQLNFAGTSTWLSPGSSSFRLK